MPARRRQESKGRRPAAALFRAFGWATGAPLASFRFLGRRRPIEELVHRGGEHPEGLPRHDPDPAHQEADDGLGPVTHRLFRADVDEPKLTPERLIDVVAADPNVISPFEVVQFERTRGERGDLREGDELLIRMAGPWDGPVKVTQRTREGFRLAATEGHAQLGQVELRARRRDGPLRLEIQTRERSASGIFHLLGRAGLIRRMQIHTWAHMLEAAAQLAGGRPPRKIVVETWHS